MENDNPNYLAWLLVITLAVTAGNLLSNYITAKAVEYQLSIIAEEGIRQLHELTRAMQAQQAHIAQQQRQQRIPRFPGTCRELEYIS